LEISFLFVQTEIFLCSSHCCSLFPECSNYYIQCDVHLKVLPHEAFGTVIVSRVSLLCDGEDVVLQNPFLFIVFIKNESCAGAEVTLLFKHLTSSEICSISPQHTLNVKDRITLVYDNTTTGRIA